jgi:hypothetical protein
MGLLFLSIIGGIILFSGLLFGISQAQHQLYEIASPSLVCALRKRLILG